MAKSGQLLENPINGDRLIFRRTAREGDGSEWETELFYQPFAGRLPIAHFHPTIDEQFEILSGSASYVLDGVEHKAERLVLFPAGVPHIHPWSISDEVLHMRQRLTLRMPDRKSLAKIENFTETLFGLAQAGKVNKKGQPNPLQMAVMLKELQPVGYVAGMPIGFQKLLFGVLAGIGRLLGYKARYPEISLDR